MYLPCIPLYFLDLLILINLDFFDSLDKLLSVPKILPKVGMKTNATSNDELLKESRKNINSPAIPGQKIREKAAKVVRVEAALQKHFLC